MTLQKRENYLETHTLDVVQTSTSYTKPRTLELVLTSMLIVLVFVATLLLNIKLPITANGGLVHLGTAILFIVSIPFMIAGYYVCERVLFNSWIIPLASILGDIVQNIIGIAVTIPACLVLKKIPFFK